MFELTCRLKVTFKTKYNSCSISSIIKWKNLNHKRIRNNTLEARIIENVGRTSGKSSTFFIKTMSGKWFIFVKENNIEKIVLLWEWSFFCSLYFSVIYSGNRNEIVLFFVCHIWPKQILTICTQVDPELNSCPFKRGEDLKNGPFLLFIRNTSNKAFEYEDFGEEPRENPRIKTPWMK